ncbi:MAG: tRNA pseudouridine(55) synthase TruB, partial [Pseudomonadota bacterium]|nr:tRNA pseudouridine(55) synthase TruB [Pseudomonadota bacterium]
VEDGLSIEEIDALAKTPELDAKLLPIEVGLADLPEVTCPPESVTRLRNGNPAVVIASDVEYGEECWASLNGKPIAVGRFKAGELHPSRVFVEAD